MVNNLCRPKSVSIAVDFSSSWKVPGNRFRQFKLQNNFGWLVSWGSQVRYRDWPTSQGVLQSALQKRMVYNYSFIFLVIIAILFQLYDFMASKLSHFLKKRNLESEPLKLGQLVFISTQRRIIFVLGYTFSFPSVQESVNCAKLITWTQTFHCPDGVGEDAGKLLQDAIDRQGVC